MLKAGGPVRNPGTPWALSPHGLERVATIGAEVIGGDPARRKFFTGGASGIVTEYAHGDYALASGTTLLNGNTQPEVTSGDAEVRVLYVCPDGSYLVNVRDQVTLYTYLYHCADPATDPTDWDYVLDVSWDGSAQQANGGRVLGQHNFAAIPFGSDWRVIYASYPDTAAGFCRSWISPANSAGSGWAVHWDAALAGGTRHTRHFHAVYHNPVADKILYLCGDADSQSGSGVNGIVQGPVSTSWSSVDDTPIADVITTAGWTGFTGAQNYRLIDVAFINGKLVYNPDAGTDDTLHGFWSAPADLSTAPARVQENHWHRDGNPRFEAWVIGCGAVELASGDWLFSDFLQATVGEDTSFERRFRVYVTRDGESFECAGYVPVDNAAGASALTTFQIDDIIYLAGTYFRRVVGTNVSAVVKQSGHPYRPNKVLI